MHHGKGAVHSSRLICLDGNDVIGIRTALQFELDQPNFETDPTINRSMITGCESVLSDKDLGGRLVL